MKSIAVPESALSLCQTIAGLAGRFTISQRHTARSAVAVSIPGKRTMDPRLFQTGVPPSRSIRKILDQPCLASSLRHNVPRCRKSLVPSARSSSISLPRAGRSFDAAENRAPSSA